MDERSLHLRRQVVRIFECSRRGHLGATFSLIEILRVLYDEILRYDPSNPNWEKRDRCILSKGHGCLALYVILADKGFYPEEELWKFCNAEGILGGHPDYDKIPGVEASTGALGHGLSIGVGFALAARSNRADHRVFVVVGDGECNEGSIWEAAMSAGNRNLSNLCVLIDYNKQQSYDTTFAVQNLEPFLDKWKSFKFSVAEVDGHDVEALKEALSKVPFEQDKPSAIICHTVKGKGIEFAENNLAWHHKSKISDEDLSAMYEALGGC
ncbi:MAG: transketolase [Planctomycetota bacterium]